MGGTYVGQGDVGYLPWMEGTYLGGGTYLEQGVPTLDGGYLPLARGTLDRGYPPGQDWMGVPPGQDWMGVSLPRPGLDDWRQQRST